MKRLPDDKPGEGKEDSSVIEQGGLVALIGFLYLGKGIVFLFYDVPRTLLIDFPYLVFYEGPANLFFALKGREGKTEAFIQSLGEGDLSVEEEKAIMDELEALTGFFMESKAQWIEWWEANRNLMQEERRKQYLQSALQNLRSEDYWTRAISQERLRRASGESFGYDANDPQEERYSAWRRWKEWWEEEGLQPDAGAAMRDNQK